MSTADHEANHAAADRWLAEAVPRLASALDPERIILFGSHARGTATRRSDLDLCVIWDTDAPPLDRIGTILRLLSDAPLAVEAVAYTPGELERMCHSRFVRRILEEGKVLYERGGIAA